MTAGGRRVYASATSALVKAVAPAQAPSLPELRARVLGSYDGFAAPAPRDGRSEGRAVTTRLPSP